MKESKLIGREVNIIDNYNFGWGTILVYDGEFYHVAFANDKNNVLVFRRNEFSVRRKSTK